MTWSCWPHYPGPFRADHIRDGDRYELSNGHPIYRRRPGERHGHARNAGILVLSTAIDDPQKLGVEVGVAWNDGKNLRAPSLSVGLPLSASGWATTAPPLAIEYFDTEDEDDLRRKIAELLGFGTRLVWVVRLTGPLRVEVHEPNTPVRIVDADATLSAPGILERDVPVRTLIDLDAAKEALLRNALAKNGHRIREEGERVGASAVLEQTREAVLTQLRSRGWTLAPALAARVAACSDPATLIRWATQIPVAGDPEAALR